MSYMMTVSTEGQITIPMEIREEFGIKPGDKLLGEKTEEGYLIRRPKCIVRPSRAVAFEQMPVQRALKEYPELREAYETVHKARNYFASKMPDDLERQEELLQVIRDHVQLLLNSGETTDFKRGREQKKQKRQAPQQHSQPEPDRER